MKKNFFAALLFLFLTSGCVDNSSSPSIIINNSTTTPSITSSSQSFNLIGTWKPYKNVNGSITVSPSTEEKKLTISFFSNKKVEWKHPAFYMVKGTYEVDWGKQKIIITNTGGGIVSDRTINFYIDQGEIYWQDSQGTKQYYEKT